MVEQSTSDYTVQRRYTLPNLRIEILVSNKPRALDPNGQDLRPLQCRSAAERERLANRDWRGLRERLVNLDVADLDEVSRWLSDAGYVRSWVPERELIESVKKVPPLTFEQLAENLTVEREATIPAEWKATDITDSILHWLKKYGDAIRWLMTLSQSQFRAAVSAAWQCDDYIRDAVGIMLAASHQQIKADDANGADTSIPVERKSCPKCGNEHCAVYNRRRLCRKCGWREPEEKEKLSDRKTPKLRHPASDFAKDIQLPDGVDLETAYRCLIGTGVAPSLAASFYWRGEVLPSVAVYINTPLEAIVFSTHFDKRFSVLKLIPCKNCKQHFEAKRRAAAFCSTRCKNYYVTTARRKKVYFLKDGLKAWNALTQAQRKKSDRAPWITDWVCRKRKMQIDHQWATQELRKLSALSTNKRRRTHA